MQPKGARECSRRPWDGLLNTCERVRRGGVENITHRSEVRKNPRPRCFQIGFGDGLFDLEQGGRSGWKRGGREGSRSGRGIREDRQEAFGAVDGHRVVVRGILGKAGHMAGDVRVEGSVWRRGARRK